MSRVNHRRSLSGRPCLAGLLTTLVILTTASCDSRNETDSTSPVVCAGETAVTGVRGPGLTADTETQSGTTAVPDPDGYALVFDDWVVSGTTSRVSDERTYSLQVAGLEGCALGQVTATIMGEITTGPESSARLIADLDGHTLTHDWDADRSDSFRIMVNADYAGGSAQPGSAGASDQRDLDLTIRSTLYQGTDPTARLQITRVTVESELIDAAQ